jgi:hypothetical protein
MSRITAEMSVAEIVQRDPRLRKVLDRHGLKGCGGEHGPSEPIAFFAAVHQVDVDELVRELSRPVTIIFRNRGQPRLAIDLCYQLQKLQVSNNPFLFAT